MASIFGVLALSDFSRCPMYWFLLIKYSAIFIIFCVTVYKNPASWEILAAMTFFNSWNIYRTVGMYVRCVPISTKWCVTLYAGMYYMYNKNNIILYNFISETTFLIIPFLVGT